MPSPVNLILLWRWALSIIRDVCARLEVPGHNTSAVVDAGRPQRITKRISERLAPAVAEQVTARLEGEEEVGDLGVGTGAVQIGRLAHGAGIAAVAILSPQPQELHKP